MRHGDISNQPAEAVVINVDSTLLLSQPGIFKKPKVDPSAIRTFSTLARHHDYRIIMITFSPQYKKVEAELEKWCFYNEFHHFKTTKELAEWLDIWDIHNYIDSDTEILAAVFPRGILYSGSFKNTLERLR